MKKIILASASPRRKELLSLLGLEFDTFVPDCEEIIKSNDPGKVTKELSLQKAEAAAKIAKEADIIIGADTVVSLDGEILGKPYDRSEAYKMIHSLQGKTHQVFTGVTIIYKKSGEKSTFCVKTDVTVAGMSEEEINEYINTKEPYDKAGAYGIQGLFGKYVEAISGDYFNVVGLPIHSLYKELRRRQC